MRYPRTPLSAVLLAAGLMFAGCGEAPPHAVVDADATANTDGSDSTDGTDGSDSTDGTDGTDSTDGATGTDPISIVSTEALTGTTPGVGALAAEGMRVGWCDGSSVVVGDETYELSGRCVAVALIDGGAIAVTHTGSWERVGSAPASQPGPVVIQLAASDDVVYGAAGTSGLIQARLDLSQAPTPVASISDARDVAVVGDRVVVAAGTAGIALLEEGVVTATASTTGSANAVAALGPDRVAVAALAEGVVLFDVAAAALTPLGSTDTNSTSLDLAWDGGDTVLVADWIQATLVDISDPQNPTPVARERFASDGGPMGRAVATVAANGEYVVLSLDAVHRVSADASVVVAELHLDRFGLQVEVTGASGGAGLLLYNVGRAELVLGDFVLGDDRVSTTTTELTIKAGKVEFMELAVQGATPLTTTLTFTSNDPDFPTVSIPVEVNPARLEEGEPAADFVAPTIAGTLLHLSDLAGKVPHLKLFNAL